MKKKISDLESRGRQLQTTGTTSPPDLLLLALVHPIRLPLSFDVHPLQFALYVHAVAPLLHGLNRPDNVYYIQSLGCPVSRHPASVAAPFLFAHPPPGALTPRRCRARLRPFSSVRPPSSYTWPSSSPHRHREHWDRLSARRQSSVLRRSTLDNPAAASSLSKPTRLTSTPTALRSIAHRRPRAAERDYPQDSAIGQQRSRSLRALLRYGALPLDAAPDARLRRMRPRSIRSTRACCSARTAPTSTWARDMRPLQYSSSRGGAACDIAPSRRSARAAPKSTAARHAPAVDTRRAGERLRGLRSVPPFRVSSAHARRSVPRRPNVSWQRAMSLTPAHPRGRCGSARYRHTAIYAADAYAGRAVVRSGK
ncbi:hypothetical protein DFH06DRAFT_1476467 [Mycena polygramma]|nr:hypothetical protein DFH06DRAFT_1476467 [Mycena polygramma]